MINETIAIVHELKNDVKGLMTTTRDGLKNEKAWLREMGKNMSEKLQDFQTEMATSNQDIKLQIDTLDRDFKLKTTNNAQSVINEGVSKIIDELEMRASELETENQALNQTINDLQSENENMKADNLVLKQTIKDIKMDLKAMYGTEFPCREGWKKFQGHCYLVVKYWKTFDEAITFCEDRDAYLTEITSDEEFDFVNALARVSGVNGATVGVIYNESEGRFVYKHSGQIVPEKYWRKGELANRVKGLNCAYLVFQELVASFCGSNAARFICEKS